jgi:aldehyde dehydrogenase (NAD+)
MTVAETGSPVSFTYSAQLDAPVEGIGWVADLAESYQWETDLGDASPMGMPSHRWVRREATGVVGAITPWNVPHQINLAKLGPALAAGNTVVLKPAPDTPWCATVLGRLIAEETDIPPGVVNIVPSAEHSLGALLSGDPRVDQISFTGSTATGKRVMASAAESLKKVFLELGGKSAFVILDDADLRGAVATAAFTVCTHAGQGCAITTRLLVPRHQFDEAVESAAKVMAKLPASDPTDPGTICGPLISARQRERVEGYLTLARDEGGTFVTGGGRPDDHDRGYFVEPTLIVGLPNSSRVAQEEIFGPVLVVIPHDGDDDAVALANDSAYGLSGSVWSADRQRAVDVSQRIRTGTIGINGGLWFSPDVPFGGYKHSGVGRESGVAGFEEYLETKSMAEPA